MGTQNFNFVPGVLRKGGGVVGPTFNCIFGRKFSDKKKIFQHFWRPKIYWRQLPRTPLPQRCRL